MRSNRAFDYARILRFAVVGVLNTTLGYSIIVMGLALGYGDIISNISGYAGGLILGFVLNRRWTFSDATHLRRGAVLRYASGGIAEGGPVTENLAARRPASVVDLCFMMQDRKGA